MSRCRRRPTCAGWSTQTVLHSNPAGSLSGSCLISDCGLLASSGPSGPSSACSSPYLEGASSEDERGGRERGGRKGAREGDETKGCGEMCYIGPYHS